MALRATKCDETKWRAGNSARRRLSAGSGRLKGGCGQDWPPSSVFSTVPHKAEGHGPFQERIAIETTTDLFSVLKFTA
jgi:hypothetical protein